MNVNIKSYEEVKNFVESNNCKLITVFKDYLGKNKPIEIKCGTCSDRVIKTRFADFIHRKHKMCKECISKINRNKTYDDLKRFIESESESGCILLSTVEEYKNNTSKIKLSCKCGNEFTTTNAMFVHSGKRQCNECGFKRKGRSIPYEEILSFVNEMDCELLTKKEDYVDTQQILNYKCSCGEKFEKSFHNFKHSSSRCYDCYKKELSARKLIPYEEVKHFIEVESDSGCKLLTTKDDYVNTRLNVDFLCKCGEKFTTSVHEFKSDNKRQCNVCGLNYMKTEVFLEMFNDKEKVNYCKLIDYEDTGEFIYTRNIISLKCKCGDIFKTQRSYFTNNDKTRCDKCANIYYKGEEKTRRYLIDNNIEFQMQYCFNDCKGERRVLPFDFAVFDKNDKLKLLIEYDGKQHFEPVNFGGCSDEVALFEHENLKRNDEIKNNYCKENKINLIRIPYWEFNNIEEILTNELNINYTYN